jgi:hypothetical protein
MEISVAKNRWGVSDGYLDLSVDFATYCFGAVSPQRKYQSFALQVVEVLKENAGKVKTRKLTQDLRFDGKHATKEVICEAGFASGLYKVDGSEVVLIC